MLTKIKALLKLLIAPEALAVIQWWSIPASEHIAERNTRQAAYTWLSNMYQDMSQENKRLGKALKRFSTLYLQNTSFGFECGCCKREGHEVAPPVMRWLEGQGWNFCGVCAEYTPEPEGTTQVRQ